MVGGVGKAQLGKEEQGKHELDKHEVLLDALSLCLLQLVAWFSFDF